jgi:hypothetical protein
MGVTAATRIGRQMAAPAPGVSTVRMLRSFSAHPQGDYEVRMRAAAMAGSCRLQPSAVVVCRPDWVL